MEEVVKEDEIRNELEILYRDEHYVAINKPGGLLVHRTRIAEEDKRFALQMLRNQLGQHVYPVHRLDRQTAGVLVFALNSEAAGKLRQVFDEQQTEKIYLAVARGYTPEAATIDNPIKPDKDHQHKEAQDAVTHYRRLATVELPIAVGRYQTARYSLVEIQPETGRMHQIRKHFAHIRHYLIGDKRHGDWRHNLMFKEQLHCTNMLLLARRLTFVHPYTKQPITIQAPLPEYFIDLFNRFGWDKQLADA